MAKMIKFFALNIAVALAFCLPCHAQKSPTEELVSQLEKLTAQLNSTELRAPERAMDALGNSRAFAENRIREALEINLKQKPNDMNQYDGSFNMICRAVGEWRVEYATGPLLSYIDLTLDPASFGVGATFGRMHYYPAALALVEVRSRSLNRDLVDLLAEPVGDNKLQIIAWMLQKSNGSDVAAFIAERELTNYEKQIAITGSVPGIRKDNLLKIIRSLESEKGAFLPPVEGKGTDGRLIR